jgi:hypothetical protein
MVMGCFVMGLFVIRGVFVDGTFKNDGTLFDGPFCDGSLNVNRILLLPLIFWPFQRFLNGLNFEKKKFFVYNQAFLRQGFSKYAQYT